MEVLGANLYFYVFFRSHTVNIVYSVYTSASSTETISHLLFHCWKQLWSLSSDTHEHCGVSAANWRAEYLKWIRESLVLLWEILTFLRKLTSAFTLSVSHTHTHCNWSRLAQLMLTALVGHIAGVCVSQAALLQCSLSELCVWMIVCVCCAKTVAAKVVYSAHLQASGPEQVASVHVSKMDTGGVQSCMTVRKFGPVFLFYKNSLYTQINRGQ